MHLFGVCNLLNLVYFFSFLEAFGSYVITPILSLYIVKGLNFSLGVAATSAITLHFSRYILSLPIGKLTDILSTKVSLALGTLIRALGYLLLALGPHSSFSVYSAVFCIGLGGAFITPSISIILSVIKGKQENKFRVNSFIYTSGIALSLLVVSLVNFRSLNVLFFYASASFAILLLISPFLLSPLKNPKSGTLLDCYSLFKSTLSINLSLFIFTLLYSQLYYFIPMLLKDRLNPSNTLSIIYAINCTCFVVLQPLIIKYNLFSKLTSSCLISAVLFLLGFAMLKFSDIKIIIIVFSILYGISCSILEPKFMSVIATLVSSEMMGLASGVSLFFRGCGLIVGNLLGYVTLSSQVYFGGFPVPILIVCVIFIFLSFFPSFPYKNRN